MALRHDPRQFVLEYVTQLEHLWQPVRDGDVEGIHQARVATRRIRAALPLIHGMDQRVTDAFRTMGRELGRVREMDATGTLLDALRPRLLHASAAIATLRRRFDDGQARRRRRLIKKLDRVHLRALRRGVAAGPNGVARITAAFHGWPSAIRTEVARRAHNTTDVIERASGIYMPNRVHRARIKVKKLRYALELGLATGVFRGTAPLASLKETQEVLGQLHDLDVLTKAARAELDTDQLEQERTVLFSIIDMERSRLHAKYLRRRDATLEACRKCIVEATYCGPIERVGRLAARALPAASLAAVPLAVWYLGASSAPSQSSPTVSAR